ncbi:hypothetical protein LINPERPRIM_LOCUS33039, partial [Linum perenne]
DLDGFRTNTTAAVSRRRGDGATALAREEQKRRLSPKEESTRVLNPKPR